MVARKRKLKGPRETNSGALTTIYARVVKTNTISLAKWTERSAANTTGVERTTRRTATTTSAQDSTSVFRKVMERRHSMSMELPKLQTMNIALVTTNKTRLE